MGIEQRIKTLCTQTCVYWAPTGFNAYTDPIFAAPVEVKCRWEEKQILFEDDKGNQLQAKAVAHVVSDVKNEGFLYLGTLTSLTTQQRSNPKNISSAYPIKRFDKSPSLTNPSEYVRKAYLTPYGGMS